MPGGVVGATYRLALRELAPCCCDLIQVVADDFSVIILAFKLEVLFRIRILIRIFEHVQARGVLVGREMIHDVAFSVHAYSYFIPHWYKEIIGHVASWLRDHW